MVHILQNIESNILQNTKDDFNDSFMNRFLPKDVEKILILKMDLKNTKIAKDIGSKRNLL